jgi:hypothetical protein
MPKQSRRGQPDWLISLATGFEGDTEETDIANPELTGMSTDKSLVETEIMLTAWFAGRGFTLSSHWRIHDYSGSGHRAVDMRGAEFTQK